uniref:Uncharacterized protein n=1 Tax=Lepeophtheirus salmonis TaxID=72036 RepID=A0A0K2UTL9_LEPSM
MIPTGTFFTQCIGEVPYQNSPGGEFSRNFKASSLNPSCNNLLWSLRRWRN